MDPQFWQEIKRAHEVYNSLQTEERPPYLDQIKGENEPLYHALIDIIQAEDQETTFLSHSAFESIQPTDNFQDLSGLQLGNYRLKYLIGVGGMGQVYLADRTDLHAHQQVAIKIIHKGYQSDLYNKRFDRERRILSKLNHPHITRIYDGGITQDGMSYIVMEYIQGVPIMEYIQDNQLLLKDRLTLFKDLCSAVQYAHQNFIMHRDLKPSNVLVNAHGMVKIIDFGIAKILEEDEAEDITMMGYLPMTPAYASPEQLKGQPLTVSSDIYSLGVLLYELLTGKKPFHDSGDKSAEIWSKRLNDNIQIPRPSSNIQVSRLQTEPRLASELQGDLDNIVLKSLRENPDERYHSAGQLLEDIERYEKNYPVLAQPDSTIYRFKKYIRRNKNFVILATCLILALIAGIVTTLWQATIASAERDQANKEAAKAEQITEFVTSLFELANPDNNPGEVITSETMLDMGSERLVELDDQPALQAEMYRVIGYLYSKQSLHEKALENLKKARDLFVQEYGKDNIEAAKTNIWIIENSFFQDQYNVDNDLINQTINIIEKDLDPVSKEYINIYDYKGRGYHLAGKYDSALIIYQNVETKISDHDLSDKKIAKALGSLYNDMATTYNLLGNPDSTMFYMHKALRALKSSDGEKSMNVSMMYSNISSQFVNLNMDSAEYYARKSYDLSEQIMMGKPSVQMTTSCIRLAKVLETKNDLDQALTYALRSINYANEVYGPDNIQTSLAIVTTCDVYIAMDSFDQAIKLLERAERILTTELEPDHPILAFSYWDYAVRYWKMKQFHKALDYHRKALAIYEEKLPHLELDIAEGYEFMADYLIDAGQPAQAGPYYEKASAKYAQLLGENHEYNTTILNRLVEWNTQYGSKEVADSLTQVLLHLPQDSIP